MIEVDCDDIVDLRSEEARSDVGVALKDMASPWGLALAERKKPLSWDVVERLLAKGARWRSGPLFRPSRPCRPDESGALELGR